VLVADQPEKIEADHDEPALRIGPRIKAVTDGTQQQLLLISPYFIPGDNGVNYLGDLVARGVTVKVLTNSLASTDEPAVHAGYAHYRATLLHKGVLIYELRPAAGTSQKVTARGTSSGVSLHAKAIVVDRQQVFVGSMNMDQRSKLLNTEMGIIVDSPALAQAVAQFFDSAVLPGNAYHVVLRNPDSPHSHALQWQASNGDKPLRYNHDPDAALQRRLEVALLRLLPIDGML